MVKDCLDRLSFKDWDEFMGYVDYHKRRFSYAPRCFDCDRCGRLHFTSSMNNSTIAQDFLQRERCVSNRDLHLQMARVIGISLEELQTRVDLSKITLAGGPGVEAVTLGPSLTKKPWE